MLVKSAVFIKSGTQPAHYPADGLSEIAFAGRSNVGKSTLINTLTGRKGLVRTSSTPGRTQLINFFSVNDTFRLVDLPGYGFAQVPLAVKRQWGPMVRGYLEGRSGLKAVVLLFDIRRIPREEDLQLLDWLEAGGVPTIPVVTKVDKVGRGERERQLLAIAAETGLPRDAFTLFSAVSREGRDELWERIETALASPDGELSGADAAAAETP